MRKEYRIEIFYKDEKVNKQELWHITDYCEKGNCFHFINRFGSIFILPLSNILYFTVRKEDSK